jgi:eukaryotic-like serine/threonine-protein kinase
MKEGLEALEKVMRSAGVRFPKKRSAILLGFLIGRIRLRLRGLNFRQRSEVDVTRKALKRMDALWEGTLGLGMVDTVRGALYSNDLSLEALRLGLKDRLVMALSLESVFISSGGLPSRRRAYNLIQMIKTLAEESGKPIVLFWSKLAELAFLILMGEFYAGYQMYPQIQALLEQCQSVFWEKFTIDLWTIWSLVHTGLFHELRKRMPQYLYEAEMRGDRYAITNLNLGLPSLWRLIDDDPNGNIQLADQSISTWDRFAFQLQDYYHILAKCNALLYQNSSPYKFLESKWTALKRSQLLRIQLVNLEALHLRARAALKEGQVRFATKYAKKILKARAHWASPMAHLILAGVAMTEGNKKQSIQLLLKVREEASENHMNQYTMVANWQLGRLIGGQEGQVLINKAEAWAAEQGVKNWPALARMYGPGFPE